MSGLLALATAGEGEQDFAARIRGRAMAGAAVAALPPIPQERTEYPPDWESEEGMVGPRRSNQVLLHLLLQKNKTVVESSPLTSAQI